MDKIMEHARDLHVVATKIYATVGGTDAFVDVDMTTKFTPVQLKEAFVKGALVFVGEDIFVPIAFVENAMVYANAEGTNVSLVGAESVEE